MGRSYAVGKKLVVSYVYLNCIIDAIDAIELHYNNELNTRELPVELPVGCGTFIRTKKVKRFHQFINSCRNK